MLRTFYAVMASREEEINSGVEDSRRGHRRRQIQRSFVRRAQVGASPMRAHQVLGSHEGLTDEKVVFEASWTTIIPDASPEGLGGVLVINSQALEVFSSGSRQRGRQSLGVRAGVLSFTGHR